MSILRRLHPDFESTKTCLGMTADYKWLLDALEAA
jgi:hypothetical protein